MESTIEDRRAPDRATGDPAAGPAWSLLKSAILPLRDLQQSDGSLQENAERETAARLVAAASAAVADLAPFLPADAAYLAAVREDLAGWVGGGFGVPDFSRSLAAFHPELARQDGLRHLVLFPMYTQNGSRERLFEAVLIEVRWPDFAARLEATAYSNALFVPVRFLDFTPGYDSDSAVLFPETVSTGTSPLPRFTWGAIFADREAARFRRVVSAAAPTTRRYRAASRSAKIAPQVNGGMARIATVSGNSTAELES